ncbi:hypothetical protein BU17DRAFT_68672 [Hysterangium stoloniferum]|nr:hypothetical protein BU17DRAFT_68672 [Hysterangium stoloniferum]
MPRSTPPPQRGIFHPPNEAATHRDLLLFEERLKTNAANLKRRKSRYQLFLAQLLIVIAILLSDVLLYTSFLALPLNFLLSHVWPDRPPVQLHPYFTSGLLFIAVTTLVLFYASGLYAEKIGYANRYVPHANRALRSFNIYLNVRSPPLRTSLNPFRYFFPGTVSPPPAYAQPIGPAPRGSSPRRGSAIPPIPPTSNPRGELIFSSRVDPAFREAYEQHRAKFEQRRAEQRRANQSSWLRFIRWPWRKVTQPPPRIHLQPPLAGGLGSRERTHSTTPSSSRKSTPTPDAMSKGGSRRGRGSRGGTPGSESGLSESFNSILTGTEIAKGPE